MSARKTTNKKKDRLSAEELRRKLKLKHLETKKKFSESFGNADKLLKEKGLDPAKVREHSAKVLGAGAISGALLLSNPSDLKSLPAPHEIFEKMQVIKEDNSLGEPQKLLVDTLSSILPKRARPLDRNEEKLLEQLFENILGISTRATLEGEHLNTTFGYIGAEQHLKRYPGDSLYQHGKGDVIKEGIAPGLGAWGYFARSKDKLTPELVETEKWYAVVQTLYLHDWNTRQPYLRDWYKYRKVLIVNTKNGNAVVAAIADSGPAAWTGKHFGGSPEAMDHLGGSRYKKGPVILFFVDDPENKVPLGPVEYKSKVTPKIALKEI
jgi:hypothetical protein